MRYSPSIGGMGGANRGLGGLGGGDDDDDNKKKGPLNRQGAIRRKGGDNGDDDGNEKNSPLSRQGAIRRKGRNGDGNKENDLDKTGGKKGPLSGLGERMRGNTNVDARKRSGGGEGNRLLKDIGWGLRVGFVLLPTLILGKMMSWFEGKGPFSNNGGRSGGSGGGRPGGPGGGRPGGIKKEDISGPVGNVHHLNIGASIPVNRGENGPGPNGDEDIYMDMGGGFPGSEFRDSLDLSGTGDPTRTSGGSSDSNGSGTAGGSGGDNGAVGGAGGPPPGGGPDGDGEDGAVGGVVGGAAGGSPPPPGGPGGPGGPNGPAGGGVNGIRIVTAEEAGDERELTRIAREVANAIGNGNRSAYGIMYNGGSSFSESRDNGHIVGSNLVVESGLTDPQERGMRFINQFRRWVESGGDPIQMPGEFANYSDRHVRDIFGHAAGILGVLPQVRAMGGPHGNGTVVRGDRGGGIMGADGQRRGGFGDPPLVLALGGRLSREELERNHPDISPFRRVMMSMPTPGNTLPFQISSGGPGRGFLGRGQDPLGHFDQQLAMLSGPQLDSLDRQLEDLYSAVDLLDLGGNARVAIYIPNLGERNRMPLVEFTGLDHIVFRSEVGPAGEGGFSEREFGGMRERLIHSIHTLRSMVGNDLLSRRYNLHLPPKN